ENVYTANSGKDYHMAVFGNYKSGAIEIEADRCFMGPDGILASGAKYIKIGDYIWRADTARDIVVDYGDELNEIYLGILKAEFDRGKMLLPSDPETLKVPESKVDYVKTLGSNATAIAKQDDQIAIGTEDGSFMIIDRKGKILFEHKFTKEISAICPIKTTEGIRWAVAVCPENLKDGKASLHLIDESGRIAWKNDLTMWHFRNGTINTMFTAKLD